MSVDTWKPEVARAALDAGAAMINDVSGLRDPALADACAERGAALVVMHTRAEPKVKEFPDYDDVRRRRASSSCASGSTLARERGVEEEQIVVDPGPDFAKTPAETVTVLRALDRCASWAGRCCWRSSRKDFVGALDRAARRRDRLAGTLAAIGAGVDAGAAIVRVHDVAATRRLPHGARRAARASARCREELRLAEHLRRQARQPRLSRVPLAVRDSFQPLGKESSCPSWTPASSKPARLQTFTPLPPSSASRATGASARRS